ncbi:MAG: molybdenum cofactor guanylyltransferase [Acidimicrobiia bacterium]|nr:MAG: molybdenum cofactor guanylyltransferase [Acidimicrobiia bacterium]
MPAERRPDLVGVVLAGGRSRRMGRDKAWVEVGGRPMLHVVAGVLAEVADRVMVAGREVAGFESVPDPVQGAGPLAGLVGVMRATRSAVLLVGVDQPWVRAETLAGLAASGRDLPVVPVVEGVRQTTCAFYPREVAPAAAEELDAGGSLQSLLDRVAFVPVLEETWRLWGEDGRSWFSVDRPEDLDRGLELYGPPVN